MANWNPNCKKDYKFIKGNSLESTKNYFIAHDLINKFGDILNISEFRKASSWIKEKANLKGNFPDLLIYDINSGKKVAYNIPEFKRLDELNQVKKENEVLNNQVDYSLKITSALQNPNVRQPSKNIQGFYNDLQKQGVPNDQINLIKDSYKEGFTKDDIITSLLANNSFTVEIKTAKEGGNSGKNKGIAINKARVNGLVYGTKEFEDFVKNYLESEGEEYIEKPTQYYSNLTVPGGTNYTENEIKTPNIVPSIKGHAQFATNEGIGWFRSDDKLTNQNSQIIPNKFETADQFTYNTSLYENINGEWLQDGQSISKEKAENAYKREFAYKNTGILTKTRRILEVQSDYGQKQRKSAEPDIHIQYDLDEIISNLKQSGEIKEVEC